MAKRLLIADDSVTMQKAFAMTFAAEDVSVVAARSSDEGLQLARQSRPDLVIADVAMPGRSGYELCQLIKSDPALHGIPVFILGSAHTPVDETRVRQCGADGYTLKPFDSTAMIRLVLEALAKGTTVSTPVSPASQYSGDAPSPVDDALAVPGFAPEVHSSTLRIGGEGADADADDYGEIAIEESGGTETETEAETATAMPAATNRTAPSIPAPEDVVTPPPELRPVAAEPAPAPLAAAARAPMAAPPSSSWAAEPAASRGPLPAGPSVGAGHGQASPSGGGLRPSLIPGLKPGTIPAAAAAAAAAAVPSAMGRAPLPGASPGPTAPRVSPSASGHGPSAAGHSAHSVGVPVPVAARAPGPAPAPPVPSATPASARTLLGLPAAVAQPPPRPAAMPTRPSGSATSLPGLTDAAARAVTGAAGGAATSVSASASVGAVVASRVDQKMAAFAARGPEYDAIAKLSREIIERVVWEVVPQLAEAIVREELAKRGRI